jgi:hypothetical protein
MTVKAMVILVVILLMSTAFGFWRHRVSTDMQPVAQIAIMRDTSSSEPSDCEQILSITKRVLSLPETVPGSTINLFATGNRTTANEPKLIGTFQVPVIRRVIEGQRHFARQREELLLNVKNRCAAADVTDVSPIFQAIKRGVEQLQNSGSASDPKFLFILTDGEETADSKLKRALAQSPGDAMKLPSPIRNGNVHVVFCGMAETIGFATAGNKSRQMSRPRDPKRADRLREVWSNLFTNPELVRFEPYCIPTESSD